MQSQPLRRAAAAQSAEAFTFEAKLDNEEATLDAMLASLARGTLHPGTWERLRAAAQRDGRLSELAFAFESASQAKRIKALSPGLAAEFLFQAACFFADAFGDELGAVTYLERALALLPTHAPSFIKIDQILHKAQQPKKLASICATVALHRARGEQPGLLRRAADLLMEAGGADDKVIDLLNQVLRLEPGDEQTRGQLEAMCIKANRLRDVARLNEQALGAEPPPDEGTRKKLLSRIVEVYADKLHEPERALPHVEQLLTIDPANEQGRKVAQKLVVVKGLAGRAAAALANAYEAFGTPQEVARYLTVELENTRGPKRAVLLARLGKLKEERLADHAGAFEAFEQALVIDAADDELRAGYVALARKLGRPSDAAKTLSRVLATVKSPDAKARACAQLGAMQLLGGDAKRAKATLVGVLGTADAPPDALLAAAYTLLEIQQGEKDARALSDLLERISGLEPDTAKRQIVDERLADVATQLRDAPRAIAAYERLLSTSARPRALAALAPLYEAGKDPEKHARLLEEQAKDTPDPQEARQQMMRAAEVRANATADAGAAIATCRAVIDRFGPARDVLALLVPLLDGQRRWPDLARALAEEAALTEGLEHAQVMTRLGTLRMQRLGDIPGAIEALGQALAVHAGDDSDSARSLASLGPAGDRTARMMLEKLTVIGDHRLAAARVLEPLYRQQGSGGALLKMLELRGALEEDVDERLEALREAARLADGAEAGRATEVIGRALVDAVANDRPLSEWFERLDASAHGADARRRAGILGKAIGDREVTSEDLSKLAKQAAEAHAAAGDVASAIALYRRALAFEPHSTELLARIDDLLRDQGSPKERIALYRAALARSGVEGRKALLHRIGGIERDDLGDVAAAIETYRAALADDQDDADAQAALRDLYAQSGRWGDLCALLEAWLTRVEGTAAQSTRATLALVAATHGDELRARAQCARLLEDPELAAEHLDAVGQAAQALGDADLERAVLQRQTDMTQEPREQIVWLDRLAELDAERRGDLGAAASVWRRAASLAERVGDDSTARRLYWRARKVAPEEREVTARLAVLCERAQSWDDLPRLYESLAEESSEDAERVDLWLRTARVLSEKLGDAAGAARRAAKAFELMPTRADVLSAFEDLSIAAAAADAFEHAIDDALARLGAVHALETEQRVQLMMSRARVLASDPRRVDDAARTYRAILDDRNIDRAQGAGALAAFESLVTGDPNSPDRRGDHRWLLEWRAERASEAERVARLIEWAREEETTFSDPVRALGLYQRAHQLDPDSDEALSAVTRLALATGDTDEALSALRARRDRADGSARTPIELEIAQVLLSKTTRWQDALAAVRAVLDDAPGDPTARALAEQLLAHRTTRADAIRLLERACDATDDASARAKILARLLDAPAETGEWEARCGWFERLCDLQREQGIPESAMATALRAAREMPEVHALWDRAEGLARALSRPDEMAALYEEVLARPLTSEQARAIGERAVQFYEEWFEDSAQVVRILERVLALDPNADWAFDRLKLLFDAAERWDDLFALYDRALDSATGRKRTILLEDAAQTAKDFADRPDRAIHYLEQLNALKPGDAKLTGALERLYERQGRHRELVGLLTTRLPTLKRDEAERARARIALLWLDGLGDPVAAFEMIEPTLQRASELAGRATSDVWTLLERVLAAATPTAEVRRSTIPPARSTAPPPRGSERPVARSKRGRKSEPPPPTTSTAVRQRAAAWLREHYAKAGRDADLVRMLLVELEAVKTAKERVRRHMQIAECYEKLGEGANALEQVGHAVVLEPQDEKQRAKLALLAEETGRLERLADLLTTAGDACDDQALRIALTMQAAAVRADRIADTAGAIGLLSSVLATARLPEADVLAAGRKLDPLLLAAGREEEQLDVLERVASVEPDAVARRNTLGRAAHLAAQLGQDTRAIALWEKRVGSDEQDSEALDGLVVLLERAGRSERLAEVLTLRARSATSDEHRRADRVRVANLLGDVLDRPKEAIAAWLEIENTFGEADDAAFALARLLRTTQRWKELAQLLERGSERTRDAAARAELLRQLGDLHRVELEADTAAVETYARALSADPGNAGARSGLLAIANRGAQRAMAVSVLLEALRACDDWRGVLELTAQRLLVASSDADKVAVLRESAQISEHRASDPSMAFEAMRSAFVIVPGDDDIEHETARLADAATAWQRLVAAYREAIDGAAKDDPVLVARLRAKAGATLETRLDDARGALATYLQVVQESSDVDTAGSALRVAGALAEWDAAARVVVDVLRVRPAAAAELLDAYGRAAERAGTWDEATRALTTAASSTDLASASARDVQARIAEWHRDRRNDPDEAETALQRALAHDGTDARLLTMLVELQRRQPGRPLVDTLLRLSRTTGEDLALLREAAEVAREACRDLPLSRVILTQLLELARQRWDAATSIEAPSCAEWAIESLAQIHETEADDRSVVQVLVQGDSLPFEKSVRRAMRRRAARIALDRLGDDEQAIALYLALFDEDAHDAEAAERLASIFARRGELRQLLSLRERQIATAEDAVPRIALRLMAAQLLVQLGERARAVDVLRVSLGEDERHEATVEALANVLDEQGHLPELRDLLVDQAQRAESAGLASRATELWWRAAVLAEQRLRDDAAAEAYLARVAALEPRPAALDALGRLAMARGDHRVAAEWLERFLHVVDAERRGEATLRLADAWVGAGEVARATERLAQAVVETPQAQSIRDRLAALYRDQGEWARLAMLVADAAAHAPDKAARMARLLEAARLFSERCEQPQLAIPLLEQATDLTPDDQSAALALAAALAQSGRFDEARALLKSMVEAFGGRRPKERAPVHYQIASLELAMGNRARALVELDTASRVDPQNPDILRALAELARDDAQLERAEKSYRALLAVLRRRAEVGGAQGVARSEVLLELSAIAERQGEHDRAHEILESALETAAQGDFEHERLESALRARGDHQTLVRVLESKLARTGDSPGAAKTLSELAELLADRLGRPDEAFSVRLRAVALEPESDAAHQSALTLARTAGGATRYVEGVGTLVEHAVERGEVQLACVLLVRQGTVAERDLGDDARAAALYERAVELGLRTPEVLGALDRVFDRLGDTERQARALSMRIEVQTKEAGPQAASDATYRLATLRLASRETLDSGVELMQSALRLDPQLDRAEEALRRAVALDPGHGGVLDLYESVGRQPGHERALVDALRVRAELPGAEMSVVREAVQVALRLDNGALAESLLARFIEREQGSTDNVAGLSWALDSLASLRHQAGDAEKAVELKRAAARLADPEIARKLSFEVARIATEELHDWALAADTYERLHQADPADRDAWEPLLGVYRHRGDTRKLTDLLGSVVDYIDEPSLRARLRLERVRAMQELGLSDAEAAPLLREIVDEDASQVEAALLLGAILERSGNRRELTELLASQIDAAKDRSDAASIASLSTRLGVLLEPEAPLQARNVYYTALEWEPKSSELLDRLAGLLHGEGDAAERADVLERRLALEKGTTAEPMAQALWTARMELGDEAAAQRALELGYRGHPASAALRDRLETSFRERREWRKLAELCELDASARDNLEERVARFWEAATIWRTELKDPRRGATALRLAREAAEALAGGPGHPDGALLNDHINFLLEAGDHAAAVSELSSVIDALAGGDPSRAAALSARAGIRLDAHDEKGALEDLEAAFAIDPATYASELVSQLERAREAAMGAGDVDAVRALSLRQAHVAPSAGNAQGARAILVELLRQDPKDRSALRALASLEQSLERWDAASAVLKRLVGLEGAEETIDVALRLADACERAGRPGDARGALERARGVAPQERTLRERLERVYEQTGAWHELADLVLADARASGDVASRFELLLRAGSLLLEQAGDPQASIEALEEARTLRPLDPSCIARLADAYTLSARAQDAALILEPVILQHKGRRARELAPLHFRLARVARYFGNATEEARSLVLALECDSQNGEVCSDVALRAMEIDQLELANRALRAITLLKTPGPMSKALSYQYMGEIAHKQGDAKRALTLLNRALAEDPSLEGARALVQSIERS